jgi:hypothetical protein
MDFKLCDEHNLSMREEISAALPSPEHRDHPGALFDKA